MTGKIAELWQVRKDYIVDNCNSDAPKKAPEHKVSDAFLQDQVLT
jgi:hypothetical protein